MIKKEYFILKTLGAIGVKGGGVVLTPVIFDLSLKKKIQQKYFWGVILNRDFSLKVGSTPPPPQKKKSVR